MGKGHVAKSSICQSEEFGLYLQAMRDFEGFLFFSNRWQVGVRFAFRHTVLALV